MVFNKKYAKLNDTRLVYAPNKLVMDGKQVFNASAAEYKANGYLPLVKTEQPQATEDYYFTPYYVEENETIVQKWRKEEIPVDDNATEADYLEALAKLGVE